ncbi:MAG: GNAT family N-acetyltransferase, partial [Melioribacteraceae bacterium]|nr:GNAT family N-acetyltransferase [Melioribacteraceae bacterium]
IGKMSDFIIKRATKKDAHTVLKFIRHLSDYEKLSHEVIATEEDLIRNLLNDESNAEAIIGYYKNIPISFAVYFYNFSTFLGKKGLYLEDIYVLPEYRGSGFGKKMLKYLAKIAIETDCGRFEWAVLDWNTPAIDFYKSIGAELKNEWVITRLSGKSLINFAQK